MARILVVAPLAHGTRDRARELVAAGPPFDPGTLGLTAHQVYVTDHEAVFVFEGPTPREALEELAGDPGVWRSAGAWRDILAGRPRLAEQAFEWSRQGGSA